jgi:hypothetical protein
MRGIKFVVDDVGKKKAVLIDLEEWGEPWRPFAFTPNLRQSE